MALRTLTGATDQKKLLLLPLAEACHVSHVRQMRSICTRPREILRGIGFRPMPSLRR